MVRPPTTLARCEEIHSRLLGAGIQPGIPFPRPLLDRLIIRACRLSDAQARNLVKTGAAMGLWDLTPNRGPHPGRVTLAAS